MTIAVYPWSALTPQQQRQCLKRPAQEDNQRIADDVRAIIADVRTRGDAALIQLTERFDKVQLESVLLTTAELKRQAARISPQVKQAIDQAYQNIQTFHLAQLPQPVRVETTAGVVCEQRFNAIERVGFYIPGGTASLPSTVLMSALPAFLAGCRERVLISPPDENGSLSPAICYAALKCEVTQVALSGGAQAIAALAFGTESIAAVDKIFGPGNRYVTAAKQQVSQLADGAAIDLPAGPSELLVIADDSAEPAFVAADLLSQAEHGSDSQVIMLSPSRQLLNAIAREIDQQLTSLPRQRIAADALANSVFIETADLAEAALISQQYAPEHLSLQFDGASDWIEQTCNAGSIFVGHYAPETGGDYATGTNHVLPTYGFARNYSSLGMADFYRRYTVQTLTAEGLKALAPTLTALAEEEALEAHKQAVSRRLQSTRMRDDLGASI